MSRVAGRNFKLNFNQLAARRVGPGIRPAARDGEEVGLVVGRPATRALCDVQRDRDAGAVELIAQRAKPTDGDHRPAASVWNSTATRKQSSRSQSRNVDARTSESGIGIGWFIGPPWRRRRFSPPLTTRGGEVTVPMRP